MPNNFKLTGDYYVSKAGSDSNNGLTPDTPKRTIQAALNLVTSGNRTVIVGSGVYRETLFYNTTSTTVNLKADGYCILDGSYNNNIFLYAGNFAPFFIVDGFEIRGYPIITTGASSNNYAVRLINCVIKGLDHYLHDSSTIVHTNNVWINCNLYIIPPVSSAFAVKNCTFINCKLGFSSYNPYFVTTYNSGVGIMVDCLLYNSIVRMISSVSAINYNYNNFYNSSIVMTLASSVTSGVIQDTYGRYYDLSIATSTGDGTIGNPYGRPYTNGAGFGFSAHRTAYPTFNASSSAVDPGFNNILKQDFSLQSSSFMVGRASDFISNIGGTYVATRLNASGSTFSGSNATVDNLVFSSFSDYVISGSAVTGSVTSAPIFISSSAKVIQEIDYNGLLAFNKDTTAPTGSNVNVPDVLTYTSASNQPGANPDRLTYYMRWTTGSSQPVSDAQWENGGLWPAGSFNTFEWNTKPSVDFLGRGNGDQNFSIVNTPTFVRATWIQLRVSLRNNYLI